MNIEEHPIYRDIYDLCQEIEKLPASEQATKVVTMAAALEKPASQLIGALRVSSDKEPKRYQCFDMYCGPIGGIYNNVDDAVQSAIAKLNGDRESAIKAGLPESMAAKEVKTWDDLDKLSICVASFALQWERGWKIKPTP